MGPGRDALETEVYIIGVSARLLIWDDPPSESKLLVCLDGVHWLLSSMLLQEPEFATVSAAMMTVFRTLAGIS